MHSEIRRIVVSFNGMHSDKRMILYPEGGVELEEFVSGVGWVIASWQDVSDEWLQWATGKANWITACIAGKCVMP